MSYERVITNLAIYKDVVLDQWGELITKAMNGNPNFLALAPKVAAVTEASTRYHAALLVSVNGGREAHNLKDAARQDLVLGLRDLGFSINLIAKGDRALLETTGFPLAKPVAPRRKAKDAMSLVVGHHTVTLTLNQNPEGNAHMVKYTMAPVTEESEWVTTYMTANVLEVDGLITDCKYAFKVAPILHQQEPEFTDPVISKYVE